MEFNEHQLRVWKNMIRFIDYYLKGEITFSELTSSLEGLLRAGEFKNRDLIKKWYHFWIPLEVYKAITLGKEESIRKEGVIKDVEAMRAFLVEKMKRNNKKTESYPEIL